MVNGVLCAVFRDFLNDAAIHEKAGKNALFPVEKPFGALNLKNRAYSLIFRAGAFCSFSTIHKCRPVHTTHAYLEELLHYSVEGEGGPAESVDRPLVHNQQRGGRTRGAS